MAPFESEAWQYGSTLRGLGGAAPAALPPLTGRPHVTQPQVFASALEPGRCAQVLEAARQLPPESRSGVYRPGFRRAESRWIFPGEEWEWLFAHVASVFSAANEAYGFQIDRFVDPLLVALYPEGPGFDWHLDTVDGVTSTRKISVSILLVPPEDYEGGDLEIAPFGIDPGARAQGAATCFPSFLCHRVTPIAAGRRAALVGWIHGPPFS